MNIDILNAHCGFGSLPEPRLSEGRRNIHRKGKRCGGEAASGSHLHQALFPSCALGRRSPPLPTNGDFVARNADRRRQKKHAGDSNLFNPPLSVGRFLGRANRVGGRRSSGFHNFEKCAPARPQMSRSLPTAGFSKRSLLTARAAPTVESKDDAYSSFTLRPQIRRDYPLNLSILLSGGKETNKDSPSNGE